MWQDMVASAPIGEKYVIAVALGNGKYGKKRTESKSLFATGKDMLRTVVYRQVHDAFIRRKTLVIGVSREGNLSDMKPIIYSPKFGKDYEPVLDRLGLEINRL